MHGSLIARDIFTKLEGDDSYWPVRRGSVLVNLKTFCHATLSPNLVTTINLKDTQEIYYIDAGQGTITSKGDTYDLYPGVGILMPPNVKFSIKNSGDEDLSMYVMGEHLPHGFTPNISMKVMLDLEPNPARVRTALKYPSAVASLVEAAAPKTASA